MPCRLSSPVASGFELRHASGHERDPIELPDGRTYERARREHVLDVARRIGAGLAKAALAGRIDGKLVDLRAPLAGGRRPARDRHRARPAGRRGDPPLGRARDGRRGEAPLPGRRSTSAAATTARSSSTTSTSRCAVHARGSGEDRGRDGEDHRRGRAVRARGRVARRGAHALFAALGETFKVSRLDDIPEGEDITLYRHGALRRPLPRAARAAHGADRRGEADRARGRVLARRRAQPDAAAHLRHGLRQARRSSTSTSRCSRRRSERDHRKLGNELELFSFHESRRARRSSCPKGMVLYNGLVDYIRALYPQVRLRRGHHPADLPRRAVQDLRPLRQLPRRHVPGSPAPRRAKSSASSR